MQSILHGFPRSRSRSPQPLTKTARNADRLNQCLGCNNVETLIRRNTELQINDEERLQSVILHHSFEELDRCARICETCCVFRQSLLLEEITFEGIQRMRSMLGSVIVAWHGSAAAGSTFQGSLSVKIEDAPGQGGMINCNGKDKVPHVSLQPNGRDSAVIEQAREWLETCRRDHIGQCDNLKFSSENPKLLVEILSATSIRLCEDLVQSQDYVALSYCWGSPSNLTPAQWAEVERGKTLTRNLSHRRQSFSIAEIPTTVRDALYIIRAMGVRYAWVDTLCICQDNPVGVENMHRIYSNALFTLSSCATTQATAPLLDQRDAWSYKTEPCRLGGQWLTVFDMSLNELRLRSPLAGRAWTLQEERLSPRQLYFSSNRVYWSCALSSEMEMTPKAAITRRLGHTSVDAQRPLYSVLDRDLAMPQSQEFLLACAGRNDPEDDRDLHEFWAEIVESYALRSMTYRGDRLKALSGVAAKYLSARTLDEYLVGIWANNLAEGLVWRVERVLRIESPSAAEDWPSWSWVKLPANSAISTNVKSARSPFFERITDGKAETSRLDFAAELAVEVGAMVKEIRIRGRVRALWGSSSHRAEWLTFSRFVGAQERFTFAAEPEQDVHAIDSDSGRVLVYEDRKREVICQFDYEDDVQRTQSGSLGLFALEIGQTTLLLIERCDEGEYRRVGAAWNVRKDFFARAKSVELTLR